MQSLEYDAQVHSPWSRHALTTCDLRLESDPGWPGHGATPPETYTEPQRTQAHKPKRCGPGIHALRARVPEQIALEVAHLRQRLV